MELKIFEQKKNFNSNLASYLNERHATLQEIKESEKAFNNLLEICQSKRVQLKLEDLYQFYNIEIYHIDELNIQEVKNIYRQMVARYKKFKTQNKWYQIEHRVFVWLLFNYSEVKRLLIEKFTSDDWKLITGVFIGKTLRDIKFQWLILLKSTTASGPWTQEQDNILKQFMSSSNQQNRWVDISKILFQNSSSGQFRKPKQCRERWKNYLNPSIQKGGWSVEQDKSLFELVLKLGKKWSIIAKIFQTRTQHAVKNRYNSLLKKFKKDHSIKDKLKSSKGLHPKQQQIIEEIFNNLNEKIVFSEESNENDRFQKQQYLTTTFDFQQPKQRQVQKQSVQDKFDIFCQISPDNSWQYSDINFPVVLKFIQTPQISTPRILSPLSFRFPVAMWQQDTAKLFYS